MTIEQKTTPRPTQIGLRPGERRLILIFGDLAVSTVSLFVALYFWSRPDWYNFSIQFLQERTPGWYYLMPFLWLLLLIELYDTRRASRIDETVKGIGIAASIALGFYLLVFFLSEPNSLPRRGVAIFIASSFILTLLWRFVFIKIFTAPMFSRRVLIVGAGRAGSTMARIVRETQPPPFVLVGLIDDDKAKCGSLIESYPVLCGSEGLLSVIEEEGITDLIFAISHEMSSQMFQAVMTAEERGVIVTSMPIVYEEILGRVPIFLLQSDWILRSFLDQIHVSGFYEILKRGMDIIGGLIGTAMLAIAFPFVAIAILLDSGAPILYSQNRLGKSGKVYQMLKFRTMYQDAEKDGKARVTVENDQRITRVGKLLRKSHLDELPQFINVLRGDMSLVGPRAERPELMDELQKVVPFYRARLLVRPGLTGWAQINFGYASTVEDTAVKMEYDLYYIKHRNLILDFTILLRTVGTVVGLRGQ
ncbi:MAG: sugar transferase [Anaerolineae bacterium]|nr:sugar transferase [Anaerolineae bacterium]